MFPQISGQKFRSHDLLALILRVIKDLIRHLPQFFLLLLHSLKKPVLNHYRILTFYFSISCSIYIGPRWTAWAIIRSTVPTASHIRNIFHMNFIQWSYGILDAPIIPISAVEVGRM